MLRGPRVTLGTVIAMDGDVGRALGGGALSARVPSLVLAASAAAWTTLGVTHPLIEVLGGTPEFFVARHAARADVLRFAVAVGVLVPVAAAALVLLAARLRGRAGTVAHVLVVAGAVAALTGGWLGGHVPGGPAVAVGAVAAVALAGGVAATAVLGRLRPSRRVAVGLALVPAGSLATFLVASPAAAILRSPDGAPPVAATVADARPVVVVVFDELPLAALLAAPDRIDADRFPNLAGLAADGVWYRNATTVSDRTPAAVPALLSGRYPDRPGVIPAARDFPVSLFTLLAGSHDVVAVEPVTDLCPDRVCGDGAEPASVPEGSWSLLRDVAVVAGHTLLPADLAAGLPTIGDRWGGFDDPMPSAGAHPLDKGVLDAFISAVADERADDLADVVRRADGARPAAYVLHTLIPHRPWTYLPSGVSYGAVAVPGLDGETWREDPASVAGGLRRLLLQVGFADRVLGDLLADLRAAGRYDDALIVVTADHGVALEPGQALRTARRETLGSILSVPLIVRYPDGARGIIDDRPVETVDIVPTVIDVLGIDTSAITDLHLDGTSLRDPRPRPATRTAWTTEGTIMFAPDEADPWPHAVALRSRVGASWDDLYRIGPEPDLVGRDVDDLAVDPEVHHTAVVRGLASYARVEAGGDLPQALLHGRIAGPVVEAGGAVAVAVDGRVVVTTHTYDPDPDGAFLQTMLPEAALPPGSHALDLYVIETSSRGVRLHPVALHPAT